MASELQIIDRLGDAIWKKNRGGLFVSKAADGWFLFALNKKREPRGFKKAEIEAISKAFPKLATSRLGKVLSSNLETSRRVQYLLSRMDTHSQLDSLDNRPMPKRSQVTTMKPELLPRLYVGLDEQSKTMNVFGSEHDVGKVSGKGMRGDEFVFQFDINDDEISKIKNREISMNQVLRTKEFNGARLLYYDDNRPIKGKRALTHNTKSMKTTERFFVQMCKEFKLSINGNIFVHVQDQWLDPASLEFESDKPKEFHRTRTPGADEFGTRKQSFSMSLNFMAQIVKGQGELELRTNLNDPNKRHFKFLADTIQKNRAELQRQLNDSVGRITKALRKVT